ncbi:MAG: MOSC N-terminal beta barrel domain-containing protein [Pseudomonadota bacterium]
MTALSVASLHIYPVKSCRGREVAHASLEMRGFEGDRRWMVTDADKRFLTQRECGAMAQIVTEQENETLRLQRAGLNTIDVAVPTATTGTRESVTVWRDEVSALAAGHAADAWLSAALARPARLFYMDDATTRLTPTIWGPPCPVSFADGFPVLVTSTASLAHLNETIAANGSDAVTMARFRPNIVIDGAEPWEEDRWASLAIGDVIIDLVKPCTRCKITTLDPVSGDDLTREPLQSLMASRRSAHPDVKGVLFGWNANVRGVGAVSVGDQVSIAEHRHEGWPLA